jgi:hypothetical protein
MSYTINLTNGTTLIPGGLSDGTIDTTHTSLVLIGKDYAGYGEFINENFIKLLENFASTAGPANPLKGQLWWDETNNILRVWSGTTWKISTGATSSSVTNPPSDLSGLGGDLWFDSTNNQLKVYTGSQWITVGPVASTAVGNTGAVPAIMADTGFGSHIVIQFLFNGVVYAILSKDTFSSSLTGFPTIRSGLTFNNSVSPPLGLSTQDVNPTPSTLVQRDSTGGITATSIVGTAITASSITTSGPISGAFNGRLTGDVVASSISSSNITTGGITASSGYTGLLLTPNQTNVTGLGTVNNLTTSGATNLNGLAYYNGSLIATQGGSASFSSINNTPVGNAIPSTGAFTSLTVNTGITPVTAGNATIPLGSPTQYWGTAYAATGQFNTVNATTAAVGTVNATTINLSGTILPTSNVSVNLGSSSSWFNNIYGTAVHAQYADLAERFEADAEYPAGTVVEMGGAKEITKVVEDLSEQVFGVISTNAAYLMNSRAGTNSTHPPVAMSGRVPVRVTGFIAKGDRLVSAGNGIARAGVRSELTPFNVIGRALENKTTEGEGTIEAIVKLNS